MHSQAARDEASRRAEGQFKSKKKTDTQTPPADDARREAEAEKTARLRTLRLAKEAADRDTANRDAAAATARKKETRRRVSKTRTSRTTDTTRSRATTRTW